jgi:hypothetical protein
MVFENFFNASLLIISRIATDQEGEVFTLQRFKNRIRQTILPEHKQQFDKRMKQFKFTNETRSLLDKVHTLRNRQIAHVTEDFAFGRTQAPVFVFRDLKSLRDRLNALLDALSFNVKYMKLPLRYHPDVQYSLGYDTRPDIENILDMIAERSTLLNMPENDPNGWKWRRDLLSERDLELLNRYRRKFHLQEV